MTKEIILRYGEITLVSNEDYEYLNQWKWRLSSNGYVVRKERKKTILLHREVMVTPKGLDCDHINGNKLDNRKENLRNCSRSTNISNCKIHSNNTTGYRGVSWDKTKNRWRVRINVNKESIYLGGSKNLEEAAKLYNVGATKYFGTFAKLNSI